MLRTLGFALLSTLAFSGATYVVVSHFSKTPSVPPSAQFPRDWGRWDYELSRPRLESLTLDGEGRYRFSMAEGALETGTWSVDAGGGLVLVSTTGSRANGTLRGDSLFVDGHERMGVLRSPRCCEK